MPTDSGYDPLASAISAIRSETADWKEESDLVDPGDGKSWRPHLQCEEGLNLHVVVTDEISASWVSRIRGAFGSGNKIAIALTADSTEIANLSLASETEATIYFIEESPDGALEVTVHDSTAAFIAERRLSLGDGLGSLGVPLLDKALAEENNYRKGLQFEQVLCLLFSQVSYFEVKEHRYKNETEEIDLVLANMATGHLGHLFDGAYVLVSAKNEKTTGAPEVRALRGNMSKRRNRCNFGILCAATRFASTVETEQHEATDDPRKAVAALDGETIRSLLSSTDLDGDLEIELQKAVLR